MEIPGGHGIKLHACFQEFVGTGFLIFAVNVAKNSIFHPVAIAIMIFTQICFTGNICGAHFNPAVTIGCLVVEFKKRPRENILYALYYMIAQILGAIMGVICVFLV